MSDAEHTQTANPGRTQASRHAWPSGHRPQLQPFGDLPAAGLLEREVGAKLVEPVGRGVRLTAEGELLADHAERILRHVEEAEAALSASRWTTTGRVRMAVFQTAALTLMPVVITELRRRHPGLTIRSTEFQPDLAILALIAHEYDLVLAVEYAGREFAMRQERRPGGFALRRDSDRHEHRHRCWRRRRCRQSGDLDQAPWVMESAGKPGRLWTQGLCRRAGFEPDVRFESDDFIVHRALVSVGHAVGMLPRLLHGYDSTPLRTIDLPGSPTRRVFTAVRAGANDRPVIKAIRLALREATRGIDDADLQSDDARSDRLMYDAAGWRSSRDGGDLQRIPSLISPLQLVQSAVGRSGEVLPTPFTAA